MTRRLEGLNVLITRTEAQSARLRELLEAEGARAHCAGVLHIEPDHDNPGVQRAQRQLHQYQHIFFVSANAVEQGLAALGPLPETARIGCIGRKTAAALKRAGYRVDDCPESGFTSEDFLALPALQHLKGQRVLIVRGHGGRNQLRETMQARGATVDLAECYHRQLADRDFGPLCRSIETGEYDVVCPSSSESLALLCQACPGQALEHLPLIAINETMAKKAREWGFDSIPVIADNATDEAILDALVCFERKRPNGGHRNDTASSQNMSEPTQTTEEKKAVEPGKSATDRPPNKERAAGVGLAKTLSFIAVILVILASLYGFEQFRQLKSQLDEQASELENLDQNDNFVTFKKRLSERLDEIKTANHSQEQRLEALDELLSEVARDANRDQRDWVLAEVRYLMNMANSRLQLLRDVDSAIAALKGADRRLAELNDPAYFATRQTLASEITALQAVGAIDSNGIALKLMGISKLVGRLPPATIVVSDDPADAAEAEAAGQHWWGDIVRWLGIRRTDRPYFVPSKQEEVFYADQLLRLEIEAARHAVLRFDRDDYQQRIDSALNIIKSYYEPDSSLVEMIRNELRGLAGSVVFPELPDISQSSVELNRANARYAEAEETQKP
ncbi:MAG: uroporphyrinogen-III C-methyltransferase [Pseudomonadota bacterium]